MSNSFEMSKSYWRDAETGKQMEHDTVHSVYVCVIVELLKGAVLA